MIEIQRQQCQKSPANAIVHHNGEFTPRFDLDAI